VRIDEPVVGYGMNTDVGGVGSTNEASLPQRA